MVMISVVMSVYNDANRLPATLDSIVAQTEGDFELIVVDDGSTDRTPAILEEYARRDTRIRIITQANAGLTRALIRGCAAARGTLIAREDAGDVSYPRRLAQQRRVFDEHDDVVLAGCLTRTSAPDGEELYIAERNGDEVRRSLLHDDLETLIGMPGHSTAMFRRDAYLRAGGYREQFWFAQDLDLWIRLASLGRIIIVPEVLHEMVVAVNSLSGRYRDEQLELARIALSLRHASADESHELLARAARVRPRAEPMGGRELAKVHYFVAAVLRRRGDRRYVKYLWRAVLAWLRGRRT